MVEKYNLDYFNLSAADDEVLNLDPKNVKKVFDLQRKSMTVVIWQTDFSSEDFFVWYYFSATEFISRVPGILRLHLKMEVPEITFPMHVSKNGKEFCIADFDYYLRHATQEQIDMSDSIYGDPTYERRGRHSGRHFDWSKCWVLWKDDFIRLANPEMMDKEQMLIQYLCIWATGFQDEGIGIIEGYSIADYETFKQVATVEQLQTVNAKIQKKRRYGYLPREPWKCESSVIE